MDGKNPALCLRLFLLFLFFFCALFPLVFLICRLEPPIFGRIIVAVGVKIQVPASALGWTNGAPTYAGAIPKVVIVPIEPPHFLSST